MNLAFVIGCSAYEDPIPSLRFAADDAVAFAAVLREACGLSPEEIVLLHDGAEDPRSRPSFTHIRRTLAQGARATAAGTAVETLFFFFSGHGYHSDGTGDDYLLAADSVADDLENTALPIREIVRLLATWRPRHVVMFLDACRETLGDGKGLAEEVAAPDVNGLLPPGQVTFCSCSAGERSYEAESLGAGVFTATLREALSEVGRCRTLYELDAYLRRRVPEMSVQGGRRPQRPVARLEPPEILGLEIVSARVRNQWRSRIPVGDERRPAARVRAAPGQTPPRYFCIDFGTCNSIIGYWHDQAGMKAVPDPTGRGIVPSVVNFSPELEYTVGWEALDADRTRPQGTIRHVKRWLGTDHQFQVYDRSLTPEFVTSLILRSLRRNAEEHFGVPLTPVLAAYPASYTLAQYNALAAAFELAGIPLYRLIGEPSASALLFPHRKSIALGSSRYGLVVDLGGGTLDVSVVDVSDTDDEGFTVMEIKGTSGRPMLGGIDYDQVLIDYITEAVRQQLDPDITQLPPYLVADIHREAERAKHVLGVAAECVVVVPGVEVAPGVARDLHVFIERGMFAALSAHLDAEAVQTIGEAVQEARDNFWAKDGGLDFVLLAGQGTKIPSLRTAVGNAASAPIIDGFEDDAVLRGLARQSHILDQKSGELLLDNLYRGIGLKVRGTESGEFEGSTEEILILEDDDGRNGETFELIKRGNTIPTQRSELLRTGAGGGTSRRLRIVELRNARPPYAEVPIGVVELVCGAAERVFEVIVDIDANALIDLTIRDTSDDTRRVIRLNSRDRSGGAELITEQRLTGSLDEAVPESHA